MKKTTVIEALDSFGDEIDIQQFIQKLLFIAKVEHSLKDVKDGRVHSFEDIKRKFSI